MVASRFGLLSAMAGRPGAASSKVGAYLQPDLAVRAGDEGSVVRRVRDRDAATVRLLH